MTTHDDRSKAVEEAIKALHIEIQTAVDASRKRIHVSQLCMLSTLELLRSDESTRKMKDSNE